jgi:hypothetical protein
MSQNSGSHPLPQLLVVVSLEACILVVSRQLTHVNLLYHYSSLGVRKLYNIWLKKLGNYHWLGKLKL